MKSRSFRLGIRGFEIAKLGKERPDERIPLGAETVGAVVSSFTLYTIPRITKALAKSDAF
jgi:hypothetical protein